MHFQKAREYVLNRLQQELPHNLYYHGIHHTLDVCGAIEQLARYENVSDEDLVLLRTAGLYHDIGFVERYRNNEPLASRIARETLPQFGYSPEQIDIICLIILATQIPQRPVTHLEMIMCDADLDYLGREDFYKVSETLYREWLEFGIISSLEEWNCKQLHFFQQHQYFTKTAKAQREALKLKHFSELQRLL
jgi:uncharacterized protein